MRIDIIEAKHWIDLETRANEAIRYKSLDDIHDIKFCLETNHPPYSTDSNYAIIIYK